MSTSGAGRTRSNDLEILKRTRSVPVPLYKTLAIIETARKEIVEKQ